MPAVRVTEDDIAIIRAVARHRFLRSTHLARLLEDRTPKKLVERLGRLYHNGYLDRPRAQLDYFATAGSRPMVYALGGKGAQILAEIEGGEARDVDWTWKNRSVGRPFLEHTLLVADLMVGLHCALRARPQLRLIEADAILAAAPEATRGLDNPWRLSARVQVAGVPHTLAVIPDAVFGIDDTAARVRRYYFLEADTGSMPIARRDLRQSSFQRKLLAYLAGGGRQNLFGSRLGIGNFRVLTLTTSEKRITTMLDVLRAATDGAGSAQMLFAGRAALESSGDPLALAWLSGKGEAVRLA